MSKSLTLILSFCPYWMFINTSHYLDGFISLLTLYLGNTCPVVDIRFNVSLVTHELTCMCTVLLSILSVRLARVKMSRIGFTQIKKRSKYFSMVEPCINSTHRLDDGSMINRHELIIPPSPSKYFWSASVDGHLRTWHRHVNRQHLVGLLVIVKTLSVLMRNMI